MDKKYLELFAEMTSATEVAAEQVMEYDKQVEDEEGYKTAEQLREEYSKLHDVLTSPDFDGKLTRTEFLRLLAGALIVSSHLKDRVTMLQAAVKGYEETLIPKLTEVIDGSKTDEEAMALADEAFKIEPETNT